MKVLILCHTKTGPTLEAANATDEGIRSAGEERFRAFGTEFVA